MVNPIRRRLVRQGLVAALVPMPAITRGAGTASHAPASGGWGFESVAALAAERARRPWRDRPAPPRERALLGYDAIRRIRFRPEQALWRADGRSAELQFFPFVAKDARALELFELVAGGPPRPMVLGHEAFDYDGVLPAPRRGEAQAAAGWRATWPLNEPTKRDELISFLGSSYFRALGAGQRYGLSARVIAVNTVGDASGAQPGEEFPALTHFWFERPAAGAAGAINVAGSTSLRFFALLDGASLTGACAFEVRPGTTTVVDVRARFFARRAGLRLGFAPLSSMFFFGENQPRDDDFRPEVHDSDGLAIVTPEGEHLWRPLINPERSFVTSFAMPKAPRGFGLLQRDRLFARYEDLEAMYHLRPSAWVEPLHEWSDLESDWGAGRIELLQFPTPDETHDNVAAYWVSDRPFVPGEPRDLGWRISWTREELPARGSSARVMQTRRGRGWRAPAAAVASGAAASPSDPMVLHVDFEGEILHGLHGDDVQPVVGVGPGVIVRSVHAQAHGVSSHGTTPAPTAPAWRVTLSVQRTDPRVPMELRLFLRSATARALSETWSYALPAAD
jgi:periplasmic glucans biosynthesis protein